MTIEQLKKAQEIVDQLNIVMEYITTFNPEDNIRNLMTTDVHGNAGKTLKLYGYKKDENEALGGDTGFTKYYREFLENCTKDLNKREEELEEELKNI